MAFNLCVTKTRKREFLEQMERVVPWDVLDELIAPFYPEGRNGRPQPLTGATQRDFKEKAQPHNGGVQREGKMPWSIRHN